MNNVTTQKNLETVIKINLGCGDRPMPGFINVDSRNILGIEYPNTKVEDLSCFADGYADYIYAACVLEHLPRTLTFPALVEWNRVLKTGGMLRLAVPDWDAIAEYYDETKDLENLLNLIFGAEVHSGDRHYRVFTFASLRAILTEAGFKRIAQYDWRKIEHAEFDDYSRAYLPHMDFEHGKLMCLNIECIKQTNAVPSGRSLAARTVGV